MTNWDKFLPILTPFLPRAPEVSMRSALAASAAEFLALTHLWRETLDTQFTVKGAAEYELSGSAIIESVLWVSVGGSQLTATDSRFAPPGLLAMEGKPTHYWMVNDTSVRLFPIPDTEYGVSISVALKPSRAATGVDDWVYESWADAIVSGAVHRLAQIPEKDWTDQKLAAEHRGRFERAVANAMARDLRQINLSARNARGFTSWRR